MEVEEINSAGGKIDRKMSEGGGNRNWGRKSEDILVSSSFFFPFFSLLPPSHFYFCTAFLLHFLFTRHALCWITHAYLTAPHLQKQWTYSLAFRVLMKACRVVECSLFPHTSSKLGWSRLTSIHPPATPYYTIGGTSTLKLPFWPFPLSAQRKFNYRGTGVYGFKPGSVWENPPWGLLSLHPSPNPPKAALLMFFFSLFSLYFFRNWGMGNGYSQSQGS